MEKQLVFIFRQWCSRTVHVLEQCLEQWVFQNNGYVDMLQFFNFIFRLSVFPRSPHEGEGETINIHFQTISVAEKGVFWNNGWKKCVLE